VEEADVITAVREALFKQDILFDVTMEEVTQTRFERTTATLLKLKMAYVDVPTGQRIESFWFGESHDTGDKGINKALVSAIKYFFLKTLLIPKAGDDTEADGATDRPAAKAQAAANRAAPAASAPRPAASRQAPAHAGTESPDRQMAREAFYTAMRECKQNTGIENIKKMAVEALNLSAPPTSMYKLDTSDFNAMTQWVYDNYTPGMPPAPPPDDSDIPF
jgi:hypothetical protein